ncbi:MAG TPA: FtsX-like permease family protein [Chitinophagaceae bacterium]|nr:FtsX-like permease family protein [Chitinophagaceae bacterium]
MWLIKLAWKNLWRNRSRTYITTSAVAFATVVSILAKSLQEGIFDNLVNNIVSSYTGHIQVHLKGYNDEQVLDNSMKRSDFLEQKFSTIPGVVAVTARLEAFSLVSSGEKTKGCMVIGIVPEKERAITLFDQKIETGKYLGNGSNEVLVGKELSERMASGVADTVILIGQGYHGSTAAGKYRVSGIMKLGSPQLNSRLLVMTLPRSQELFGADSMITSYIISLKEGRDLNETASEIHHLAGAAYEVLTWEEIMPEIKQHIESDSRNMNVIQWILYILVSFGIFSTLLIMMVERRFESGMLVAIGMSKPRLQLLVLLESMITVMMGSLAGMMISIPVVAYLSRHPIRLTGESAEAYQRFGFEPIFPTSTDPRIFLVQGSIVFIIGIVLSLYPVYVVAKLNPVNAMKK